MQVASTTTMARELNKLDSNMAFKYVTMSPRDYGLYVDMDVYTAERYHDYNERTGKFRAIKVTYPDEYYAMPNYITTKDLSRLFASGDTWETLSQKILDEYAC